MRVFYHGNFSKNISGFFNFSLFLILVMVVAFLFGKGYITWDQIKQKFGKNEYQNVSFNTLLSYSNLYNGKFICTSGIHVKSSEFNVIKTNLGGNEFTNAVLVKYSPGKEYNFDSFISQGMAANVSVCGKFESLRGKEIGTLGVWNNQITIDTYKLLDTPKPFNLKN